MAAAAAVGQVPSPQLGALGIGWRGPFPASLRKIYALIVSLRQMTKTPGAHLSIHLRRLAATDCPTSVDDGKGHASNTLLPRVHRVLLDLILVLVGVEELGGLWMIAGKSSCPLVT